MTPQEKAKELVSKYVIFPDGRIFSLGTAKQCALIAVDEILKGEHLLRLPLKYWQQVKEEIKILQTSQAVKAKKLTAG